MQPSCPVSPRASSSQLGSRMHHPPHLLLFQCCFESSHRAQHFYRAPLPSTSQTMAGRQGPWLRGGSVCCRRGTILLCRQQWGCFNSALTGRGTNSRCHLWESPGNIHSDAHCAPSSQKDSFSHCFLTLSKQYFPHLLPLCTYSEVYLSQCFRKTSKTSPPQLYL